MKIHYFFVGAHLDDAILSCGGHIKKLKTDGNLVSLLTVFAGIPVLSEPLSPLIQHFHQVWNAPLEIVKLRKKEDLAASKVLKAKCLHLDFKDAIYRKEAKTGQYYIKSFADLTCELKQQDKNLAKQIAEELIKFFPNKDNIYIFAPLAVGFHLDHRLVNKAALLLLEQGFKVAFYEDYPYAEEKEATLKAWEVFPYKNIYQAKIIKLNEKEIKAKIKAIRCYKSQLKMIFQNEKQIEQRIRKYLAKVGGERTWEKIS